MAKLNEADTKGELESKKLVIVLILMIEDMNNYFKNMSGDNELTGLNLILGSYCIHLLEAESPLMNSMLRQLNDYSQQAGSPYSNIWILHQTEEVRMRLV